MQHNISHQEPIFKHTLSKNKSIEWDIKTLLEEFQSMQLLIQVFIYNLKMWVADWQEKGKKDWNYFWKQLSKTAAFVEMTQCWSLLKIKIVKLHNKFGQSSHLSLFG